MEASARLSRPEDDRGLRALAAAKVRITVTWLQRNDLRLLEAAWLHFGSLAAARRAVNAPEPQRAHKLSYLLGSAGPEYAIESPGPNPIRYQLVTDDPGVGISAGSTQYRVGRRVGPSTTWVLDWTAAGAGTPIGAGVTRFPVGIYSDVVAGLATTGPFEFPPFFDDELTWTSITGVTTTTTRFTGIVDRTVVPERTGCVDHSGGPMPFCEQEGTIAPYRALSRATVRNPDVRIQHREPVRHRSHGKLDACSGGA